MTTPEIYIMRKKFETTISDMYLENDEYQELWRSFSIHKNMIMRIFDKAFLEEDEK